MKIILPEYISSMEELYDFFRMKLQRNFPSNLDALEDVLWDESDCSIEVENISHFRAVFDLEMTKNYFWDYFDPDSELLADILLQIFHSKE